MQRSIRPLEVYRRSLLRAQRPLQGLDAKCPKIRKITAADNPLEIPSQDAFKGLFEKISHFNRSTVSVPLKRLTLSASFDSLLAYCSANSYWKLSPLLYELACFYTIIDSQRLSKLVCLDLMSPSTSGNFESHAKRISWWFDRLKNIHKIEADLHFYNAIFETLALHSDFHDVNSKNNCTFLDPGLQERRRRRSLEAYQVMQKYYMQMTSSGIIWNILIVLYLLTKHDLIGIKPNADTFSFLMTFPANEGDIKTVENLLNSMVVGGNNCNKIKPNSKVYAKMLRVLFASQQHKDAMEFYRNHIVPFMAESTKPLISCDGANDTRNDSEVLKFEVTKGICDAYLSAWATRSLKDVSSGGVTDSRHNSNFHQLLEDMKHAPNRITSNFFPLNGLRKREVEDVVANLKTDVNWNTRGGQYYITTLLKSNVNILDLFKLNPNDFKASPEVLHASLLFCASKGRLQSLFLSYGKLCAEEIFLGKDYELLPETYSLFMQAFIYSSPNFSILERGIFKEKVLDEHLTSNLKREYQESLDLYTKYRNSFDRTSQQYKEKFLYTEQRQYFPYYLCPKPDFSFENESARHKSKWFKMRFTRIMGIYVDILKSKYEDVTDIASERKRLVESIGVPGYFYRDKHILMPHIICDVYRNYRLKVPEFKRRHLSLPYELYEYLIYYFLTGCRGRLAENARSQSFAKKVFFDMLRDGIVPSPQLCFSLAHFLNMPTLRKGGGKVGMPKKYKYRVSSLPWGEKLANIIWSNKAKTLDHLVASDVSQESFKTIQKDGRICLKRAKALCLDSEHAFDFEFIDAVERNIVAALVCQIIKKHGTLPRTSSSSDTKEWHFSSVVWDQEALPSLLKWHSLETQERNLLLRHFELNQFWSLAARIR